MRHRGLLYPEFLGLGNGGFQALLLPGLTTPEVAFGLGHQIAFAYDNFDNPTMYGLILFVLCIAIVFNLLVFAYERRLARQRGL